MNCELAKTELPDYLAGNLNPAALGEVRSHMENCAE